MFRLSCLLWFWMLSKCFAFQSLSPQAVQSKTSYPRSSSKTVKHRKPSKLFSLRPLLNELIENSNNNGKPQTIFVGGKGGVGKTTISSALAVQLASHPELAANDCKVLVVSTDPAHSLGDALDENLKVLQGAPVQLTDPVTGGRLFGAEINAQAALDDFRSNLASFDMDRLADSLGVSPELLDSFGLREFNSLLTNPPPGLDELVALGNVLDDSAVKDYDIVIVDTAPTGHTLRLLQLPQFLNGLLGKLIKLRMKLGKVMSSLQALMGNTGEQQRAQTIDDAMNRLEKFQKRISNLQDKLTDPSSTSFLVVTVPTKLSVQESKRLVSELNSQGIAVKNIVVNQCVGDIADGTSDALANYYKRRKDGQDKWISKLKTAADDVSASDEYKNNGSDTSPIAITELPFFDVELVGVPALGYVGSQCLVNNPNFADLMSTNNNGGGPKVVICGGKGGVGKTTTSSSLAVTMAAQGHKVALISTDPAHSLGDAIDMNLKGGKLQDCSLVGVPMNAGEGSLSVLEVDPSASLSQFKGVVNQLIGGKDETSSGHQELTGALKDLEEIFDTLPAGTDEVVALAKVVNLVKKGGFDRIVLDTAPTGHTLRMLSTPGFLAELIDRLLVIARKVNSNMAVKMLINSAASGRAEEVEAAGAAAKSTLLSFQLQMYDLEDMFANADQTEFLIVTVPTELAVRESVRLLNDLTFEAPDMPIKVRNIVVNQVLQDDGTDIQTFLSHVRDGQARSISDLEAMLPSLGGDGSPIVTKAQYLDTEPRGVFGLKILADALLQDDK